jgi:E3 ubiquitin-protein ligase UBR1
MLGEHGKYVKLCKARVDWILERMIGGGDGFVREEVKRLRDWIDGSDVGRGGSTSGSGAARQPGLDKDEERRRVAKKRQEAIMQQMKAQQASFASMFGDGVDDDSKKLRVGG